MFWHLWERFEASAASTVGPVPCSDALFFFFTFPGLDFVRAFPWRPLLSVGDNSQRISVPFQTLSFFFSFCFLVVWWCVTLFKRSNRGAFLFVCFFVFGIVFLVSNAPPAAVGGGQSSENNVTLFFCLSFSVLLVSICWVEIFL